MDREELVQLLLRWNDWFWERKATYVHRDVVDRLSEFQSVPLTKVLIGPRRAGKSTVLRIMASKFSNQNDVKRFCYMNFEDFALSTQKLDVFFLDRLFSTYGREIYRGRDPVLLLDEIQNVEGWERWVRTVVEERQAEIYLTGSSSKLLSGELATLLTGRHIAFQIMPFSFKEFLVARGSLPKNGLEFLARSDVYESMLVEYLQTGGFPQAVLVFDERKARMILNQYVEDILFKDVVLRYSVGNLRLLKALIAYLAQNIGNRISIRKIQESFSKQFGEKASTETIANYISYLENAFLFFELKHFDYSIKESTRKPHKVFFIDTGLRNAIIPAFSRDIGRLLENAVFLFLKDFYDEIYYWYDKNEVDLVCLKANSIDLYNVSFITRGEEINPREFAGLVEFPGRSVRERVLVTVNISGDTTYEGQRINLVPAGKLLLGLA